MRARIARPRGGMPAWIAELRENSRSQGAVPRKSDDLISEVFLRAVSRPPTVEEMQSARADLAAASDPITGARDLLWVLLNTREFTVNH
jgi:hypothetical protein